jgi:arylsulfatase A-like enzyme
MLEYIRSVPAGTPYFAVLHLSNTHSPYRVDPAVLPYLPQSDDPIGSVEAFHNHYTDAVRLQERTVATFLGQVRALPSWDDTVVLFLSDHGEQFREHGGLYHNHSLFDEEVRVPGWLLAGKHVLSDDERAALATYAGKDTYAQDVHETVVDLFGLEDARATLPLSQLVTGRSLLRPREDDPTVWEPDDARFGVMRGDELFFGGPTGKWQCYDVRRDPGEHAPGPAEGCGGLVEVARREFGGVAEVR